METIKTINELIEAYKKLPGIGYRTAQRLAYATLLLSKEDRQNFSNALLDANTKVEHCPKCGTYFEEHCPICDDSSRDFTKMLVVSDSKDIITIESTKGYHGGYFTLNGTLSPLKNRTPDVIGIPNLKKQIEEKRVTEVILALPTDLEGETTAAYILNLYQGNPNISISKLANGIPIGTNLEYLDSQTITSSLNGRIVVKGGKNNA